MRMNIDELMRPERAIVGQRLQFEDIKARTRQMTCIQLHDYIPLFHDWSTREIDQGSQPSDFRAYHRSRPGKASPKRTPPLT